MQFWLTLEDRAYLEQIAGRKYRPTKRQKALALLDLAAEKPEAEVAMRVGIKQEELTALVHLFREQGLNGIGLRRSARRESRESQPRRYPTIEKTPGVCGGAARVAGTRIPVWQLVEARSLGASEAQLLTDYPHLKPTNLVDAWAYAEDHRDEIATQIRQNEVA
jgi:uncharacterized protein (DUF433 family)